MATTTDTTTDDAAEATLADGNGSRQQRRATARRCHKMLKRAKSTDKRFRPRSLESVEFFFDKQWREEDQREMAKRKQPCVVINRVKPVTKLVHGMMVAQPQDWIAKPVGANDDNLAEVSTAALKAVANQNNWRDLRAKAYWWALAYGFGVVMTGLYVRNKDPRTEPVQIRMIDPREFRWDPMSVEMDLSDARFVIWSRKVDLTDAQQLYPEHAEALKRLAKKASDDKKGDTDDTTIVWEGVPSQPTPPVSKWALYDDQNDAGKEDAIADALQVTLHELWEVINEPASLVQYDTGLTSEYDPNDPEAATLLQDPSVVRFYQADVPKVHYHCFAGNVLLKSEPSPYKHNRLPFAICWHERDHNSDPVSFIESLKDTQREINFRRAKAMKALNNPNLRVSPAVLLAMELDEDEFAAKFAAGGLVIKADVGQVEIIRENDLASAQFQWMQDSKQEIQSVSGVNDDLVGYESSSKSGLSKQVSMQQGATMQRPNEQNLRLFDKCVGEQVWQLVQQAHSDAWIVRITDDLGQDKYVSLNQQQPDPVTGQVRKINDISQARCEIEIEDGAWTPTDRERVSAMFADMANNEQDPLIRQQLRRMAIESAEVPKKAKLLEILDQAIQMMMGQVQPPQPDPAAMEMQQRMQQAEVGKAEAGAAKAGADATRAQAQAMQSMMPQPLPIPGQVM